MTDVETSRRESKSDDRSDSQPYVGAAATTRSDIHKQYSGVIAGIPAYNEEVSIGSVVVSASRFVDEVVVVDDGSTDATAKIAADAGATVLEREEKGRTSR